MPDQADIEQLRDALDEMRDLWNAARDDRDDAIRLMSELMLKTPSAGEDSDGFILGYILPTGPLHRIAAYLTEHGQSFPQARSWAEVREETLTTGCNLAVDTPVRIERTLGGSFVVPVTPDGSDQ